MYQKIRQLINEKIKGGGYSIRGFCDNILKMHINSWTRKWNNETVQLKDIIKAASGLNLILSVGLFERTNGTYKGSWVQIKPDGTVTRMDDITFPKIPQNPVNEVMEKQAEYEREWGDVIKTNKQLTEMNNKLMELILKMRENNE